MERIRPEKGKVVVVPRIPPCDFCQDGTLGPYDFATVFGGWAHGCKAHWEQYRASANLGVGTGQLWITQDQAVA